MHSEVNSKNACRKAHESSDPQTFCLSGLIQVNTYRNKNMDNDG